LTTANASCFVGERSDTIIIGLSVGLYFLNEYRAEKAAEALRSQIHHQTVVIRDGRPTTVDTTTLEPGDLIELQLGDIVPADIRLIEVTGLECDESVLEQCLKPVDEQDQWEGSCPPVILGWSFKQGWRANAGREGASSMFTVVPGAVGVDDVRCDGGGWLLIDEIVRDGARWMLAEVLQG
jgi:hypothetical protein